MTDTPNPDAHEHPADPDDTDRHPVLEALNAEGVVEHPDEPQASSPDTPADDADAPPPPG